MERTTTGPRAPDPFINPAQMLPGEGGMIDWSRVSDFFEQGKFTVKVNGAVAVGAEAVTVDPLEFPLKAGIALDFGRYDQVTVTVGGAGAAAAATAIPVNALSGPIPSGTTLDFTGAGEFAKLTANAAAGATSLAVEALDAGIEAADTAVFEGGDISVRLAEDEAAGGTSLVVEPTQFAIADDAEAITKRRDSAIGRRLPKGLVCARTAAGLLIPRRDADAETATELLVSDADERSVSDAKSGYGTIIGNTGLYENLMPDSVAGDIPAGYKTELAAAGCTFTYRDYADSRLS